MLSFRNYLNRLREIKKRELFTRVQKVIASELKIGDLGVVKLNTRFKEDLGVDSLSSIELTMGLENEFNLDIPDEDSYKLLTAEDAVNYLADKVKGQMR